MSAGRRKISAVPVTTAKTNILEPKTPENLPRKSSRFRLLKLSSRNSVNKIPLQGLLDNKSYFWVLSTKPKSNIFTSARTLSNKSPIINTYIYICIHFYICRFICMHIYTYICSIYYCRYACMRVHIRARPGALLLTALTDSLAKFIFGTAAKTATIFTRKCFCFANMNTVNFENHPQTTALGSRKLETAFYIIYHTIIIS